MIPVMQFAFAGLNSGNTGAGGGYTDLTFIASESNASPSSDTVTLNPEFTEGGASTNNKFIFGVYTNNAHVLSVSVQGSPASLVVEYAAGNDTTAIYIASFSPGGDDEVIVVCDDTPQAVNVAGWTVNMASSVAYDTSSVLGGLSDPVSSIDIPANGFGVGLTTNSNGSTHSVNAGFTEDEENSPGDGDTAYNRIETVPAITALSVTDNWGSPAGAVAVYASFAG